MCLELWKSLCPKVLSEPLLSPPCEHLSSVASSESAGCHRGTPAAPPGTACFQLTPRSRLCLGFCCLQQPRGCSAPVWPVPLCAFGTDVMKILLGRSWQPPDRVPAPLAGSTGEPAWLGGGDWFWGREGNGVGLGKGTSCSRDGHPLQSPARPQFLIAGNHKRGWRMCQQLWTHTEGRGGAQAPEHPEEAAPTSATT